MRRPQREEEYYNEIQHERDSNAHDGHDLMNNLLALVRKEHNDGVQQTDKGPRRHKPEKDVLVPLRASEPA
ncbi:hypothetical protein RRF57_010493 [Xylaria bambusicola]|uniref:Uncharacterized protein n=1 Tax=Xylaria bambusicola TaxID=326684 RepID=A0AAN7ULB1_9PEZI